MRRLIFGSTRGLPDARMFVRRLSGLGEAFEASPFEARRDVVVTRSPARLALFGGLLEQAGGTGLHLPLGGGIFVALQRHRARHVRIVLLRHDTGTLDSAFDLPLAHLEADGRPVAYDVAREYFARHADRAWPAGIIGSLLALMRERDVRFGEGFRLLVAPAVPAPRVLGSSGAIGVGVMRAVCAEANLALDATDLIALCRQASWVMASSERLDADPVTAALAEPAHLVATKWEAVSSARLVPWPSDLGAWAISARRPRGPDPACVGRARVAASMAFRLIAAEAAWPVRPLGPGLVAIDDPEWGGHLADVPADLLESTFATHLPESLSGAEFLHGFAGVADADILIDPRSTYPVRSAARHVVHEARRAREFEAFLGMYPSTDRTRYLGALLSESHESAGVLGLVTPEAQAIVDAVAARGAAQGLVGAKVTGDTGASVVAVIGESDAEAGLSGLSRHLESREGEPPDIFGGSSPGAMRFGYVRLRGE